MIQTVLQLDFFGIFNNVNAFILLMIGLGAGIGLITRKLSVGAFGGLLVYSYVVIYADLFIFDALLYLTLGIVLLGLAFRAVTYSMSGDTEAA